MTTIESFINRLRKIGIEVEMSANYPWIYLDKVNGKKVQGKFLGNHGFTCFWSGVRSGSKPCISDIKEVFKKIRETLKQ